MKPTAKATKPPKSVRTPKTGKSAKKARKPRAPRPAEVYLAWRRQAPVGCIFARRVAVNPQAHGQLVIEIAGSDPRLLAAQTERHVADSIARPDASALTIVFPGLTSLELLVGTVGELVASFSAWSISRTLIEQGVTEPMVALSLTRAIPYASATRPSEVLVLGDFPPFPMTRRSPVTAMELFVGVPMENDPKLGTPTTRANLAHMQIRFPSQNAFDRAWRGSTAGRLDTLGQVDDPRAKAKVSFVIPHTLAKALGQEP